MFWFSFIMKNQVVVVGVEEATEKGAQGHTRSYMLVLSEGPWCQTAKTLGAGPEPLRGKVQQRLGAQVQGLHRVKPKAVEPRGHEGLRMDQGSQNHKSMAGAGLWKLVVL